MVDVSVVVPVGAVDEALAAQLRALADQELGAWRIEIVLALNVDRPEDASALARMVRAVGDGRVRVVDATSRRGAAHARNAGAAAARGRYLAFCDADDVVDRRWVARVAASLERYDAVGGHLERLRDARADRWERPPATPGALPTFVGVPYIVSANLAVRAEVFHDVGGFDESLVTGEDIALSWQLLRRGRTLGYAPDAVVHYRPRPGLVPMLRQHYWYGRGMSQVLVRHGVPAVDGAAPRVGALVRPNGQPGGRGGHVRLVRRTSTALGRAHGLLDEQVRRLRRRRRTADGAATTPGAPRRIRLLNVHVDDITMDELLERREGVILTLHADMLLALQRDRGFHDLLPMFDVVTCDSQVLYAAARCMGRPVRARVSGADYFPLFCRRYADDPSVRIFLCGAAPGVADAAAARLNADAGRDLVVGTASPPMGLAIPSPDVDALVEQIAASGATVLVVALGAPKQERFIAAVRDRLPEVRLFLPLGGTLDYLAGVVRRPPPVVTDLGLEWLWRVVSEPRKRWRRYLVDDPRVFRHLVADVFGRYRDPFAAPPGEASGRAPRHGR